MLFGRDEGRLKSWYVTFGTITETFIGKNKVDDIMETQPIYAETYYVTFVLFVLVTLVTMAAAILNFSISHGKRRRLIWLPKIFRSLFWTGLWFLLANCREP
ncbi:hypothetical protein DPMN_024197 [Dreissena polymorpha]|uniref:Uncharacterized protein n=1 Tax=Dreissena polymorpha TaxID=45954 RepID=A0A9D4RCH1_DREPO|nr:hypothetical protein DPMN_024197 [Dreissena polymorpha]